MRICNLKQILETVLESLFYGIKFEYHILLRYCNSMKFDEVWGINENEIHQIVHL